MTESRGTFQINPSGIESPADSPNPHQTVPSSPHSDHNFSQQPQQSDKQESEYSYVDETGTTIVAHNFSRSHMKNDEQIDNEHSESGNYHVSGNNIGNNSVTGGGCNDNNKRSTINQQQTSISPTPNNQQGHTHSQTRSQQHSTIVRNSSPTNWQSPAATHMQQQHSNDGITTDASIPQNTYGMLRNESDILYITENCVEIGRNSSTSSVHFHVARNSFVSRKHFQIIYDPHSGDFYLICLSKNGIFVDDVFQRRSPEATKLPKSCTFRFPSTEIRIAFESFTDRIQNNLKTVENSNVIYSPLKITIPKTEQKSPYPSPTGTISAANSCPTSPRQGFQDYHGYSYNNNNNFQNELFQTPSTSTYNEHEKPPYSYAQLIVQSISASPDKQLTLSGIYSFISKHYPYYRKEANKGWQNSIRHNLSLNRYFIKVARSQDEPGKGSFWRIDPNSEAKLIDQSYKKRRQRGSQCFRPPYGMPRSAPVSPSHIDNSRENSPLHDIVLQSAPGSPGVSYQNNHGDNNHGGNEEPNNYSSQNTVQQSYNSHNQYNNTSSTYYAGTNISSTTSNIGGGSSVPLGPLKRHQASSVAGSGITSSHSNVYDETSDYGGGADSDECESIKRQKYTTEVNQ